MTFHVAKMIHLILVSNQMNIFLFKGKEKNSFFFDPIRTRSKHVSNGIGKFMNNEKTIL